MQGLLNFYLISFQKKKRRRESLPTIDLLKCFYSVDYLTIITDVSTFRPRTPYFVLGLSKIQEDKKRTEMRLAYRILGKFIKQPASFVGTRKCSISSLIPRSTCILIRAQPPTPTALHKAIPLP